MSLRISDLTVATSFVGTDVFEFSLAGAAGSRYATGSNLRKQLLAGGTGFTSTDPLNAGITTLVGGTVTTSQPVLTATQTWNDAAITFTAWKLNVTNTASAAASMLIDLQIGGTSQFKVSRAGVTTTTGGLTIVGAFAGATTGAFSGIVTLTGSEVEMTAGADFTLGPTDNFAMIWRTNNTARARISAAGILLIATTVTTGASAGDVVLANSKVLRGVNAAGTNAISLIHLDVNNIVTINGSASGNVGPAVPAIATATFAANGAANAGTLAVDATLTDRFVYYGSSGTRYYVVGTAF